VCQIVSDADTLELDFIDKGTGETPSTFTAVIEAKTSYESDWDERMAVDTATYDMSTKPNNFHTWEVSAKGVSYIRVRITAITGTISVIGHLVG
jgi:hypothetical protein